MKWRTWLALAGLAFGASMLLSGCQTKASQDKGLQVVASVDFYGEVAKAVVGTHGTVTSVIDKLDVDPHDYEPTTEVAKTVANADIVIDNGGGYDSWMTKLIAADSGNTTTVTAAKVVGIKDGENEHIWYKPDVMPKMATALAKAFGQRDPAHKQAYADNAAAYIKKLQPLLKQIDALKARAVGQKVAVSEPVFSNALSYLGYTIVNDHFAQAVEESTDPSPKDIRALEAQIQGKQIAFFVQNTQVESKIVTNIVKQVRAAGIPVLQVTETMPAGKTYTSWMTAQYNQLKAIQTKQGD
ncbi:metal ABC transporter solute-binding protein, Zn/Mn family [Lacticaseibacillus daqingensis]|uniref:metal ABC transporter solute-binding protein, Zn/Mn family n=1 Tax=Lacticaseibacillus daqingensis TaxID=2486014 RepID=UPI001CDD8F51|nr:zinc ABC transporter substrate-binding protein [Lacticaseibacillus daqingensis]